MGSWKIACFSSNPYRVFLDGNLSKPAAKNPTLQAIFTSLGNKEMWDMKSLWSLDISCIPWKMSLAFPIWNCIERTFYSDFRLFYWFDSTAFFLFKERDINTHKSQSLKAGVAFDHHEVPSLHYRKASPSFAFLCCAESFVCGLSFC